MKTALLGILPAPEGIDVGDVRRRIEGDQRRLPVTGRPGRRNATQQRHTGQNACCGAAPRAREEMSHRFPPSPGLPGRAAVEERLLMHHAAPGPCGQGPCRPSPFHIRDLRERKIYLIGYYVRRRPSGFRRVRIRAARVDEGALDVHRRRDGRGRRWRRRARSEDLAQRPRARRRVARIVGRDALGLKREEQAEMAVGERQHEPPVVKRAVVRGVRADVALVRWLATIECDRRGTTGPVPSTS